MTLVKGWRILAVNAVLILGIAIAFSLAEKYEPASPLTQATIGTSAPRFELPIVSPEGADSRLASYPQAKVTLINFWASWCGACAQEESDLRYLWDTYGAKGSLDIVGVATSDQWDELKSSPKTKAKPFTVVFDEKSLVAQAYGVTALPVSVLVNSSGEVLARIEGILDASDIKLIESKLQ